jgi:uncharacterized protein (TIGR00369 family)
MGEFLTPNKDYEIAVRTAVSSMPIARLLRLEIASLGPGKAEIHLPFAEELSQGSGLFQAGVIGALADIAGGAASGTLLPVGWFLMTVDYTVKIVAPGVGERLIGRAHVVKPGQMLTVARADVFSSTKSGERMCATALVSVKPFEQPTRAARTPQ